MTVLGRAFVATALVIVTSGASASAAGAVYRCVGGGGVPLYTDLPCNGGTIVDIRPGTADPAAIARLEREQDRFAALALAEAQLAESNALDTYERDRRSSSGGDFGSYTDVSDAASMGAISVVPIFVGVRPALHRAREHRHRSRAIAPHRFAMPGTRLPDQGVAWKRER